MTAFVEGNALITTNRYVADDTRNTNAATSWYGVTRLIVEVIICATTAESGGRDLEGRESDHAILCNCGSERGIGIILGIDPICGCQSEASPLPNLFQFILNDPFDLT